MTEPFYVSRAAFFSPILFPSQCTCPGQRPPRGSLGHLVQRGPQRISLQPSSVYFPDSSRGFIGGAAVAQKWRSRMHPCRADTADGEPPCVEATGGCTKVQEPSADGCILAEGCQADARALLCEGVTALSNGLAMARGRPRGRGQQQHRRRRARRSAGGLACARGSPRRCSLGLCHAGGRAGPRRAR